MADSQGLMIVACTCSLLLNRTFSNDCIPERD